MLTSDVPTGLRRVTLPRCVCNISPAPKVHKLQCRAADSAGLQQITGTHRSNRSIHQLLEGEGPLATGPFLAEKYRLEKHQKGWSDRVWWRVLGGSQKLGLACRLQKEKHVRVFDHRLQNATKQVRHSFYEWNQHESATFSCLLFEHLMTLGVCLQFLDRITRLANAYTTRSNFFQILFVRII